MEEALLRVLTLHLALDLSLAPTLALYHLLQLPVLVQEVVGILAVVMMVDMELVLHVVMMVDRVLVAGIVD